MNWVRYECCAIYRIITFYVFNERNDRPFHQKYSTAEEKLRGAGMAEIENTSLNPFIYKLNAKKYARNVCNAVRESERERGRAREGEEKRERERERGVEEGESTRRRAGRDVGKKRKRKLHCGKETAWK